MARDLLAQHAEKLIIYVAVCENRSFRRAAESLHLTQPPVSYAVQALEDILNCRLIIRNKKFQGLTDQGQILFDRGREILRQLELTELTLRTPSDTSTVIRFGTYESIALYLCPPLIKAVARQYPHVDIRLTTGRSGDVFHQLISEKLDLIMVVEPPTHDQVGRRLLFSDSYSLFGSHSMATDDIAHAPLIYMPDAAYDSNTTLEQYVSRSLPAGRREFHVQSFEVIREFVEKGIGIGIVPTRVAQKSLKARRIKDVRITGLKANFGRHAVYACWRKSHFVSQNIEMTHLVDVIVDLL